MTTYQVRVGLHITPDGGETVDAFTDRMTEELFNLCEDADLGGSAISEEFMVAVTVDADAPLEALTKGCILIKTAAHAAGGHTSSLEVPVDEWPEWMHEVSLAAEPVDAEDCTRV